MLSFTSTILRCHNRSVVFIVHVEHPDERQSDSQTSSFLNSVSTICFFEPFPVLPLGDRYRKTFWHKQSLKACLDLTHPCSGQTRCFVNVDVTLDICCSHWWCTWNYNSQLKSLGVARHARNSSMSHVRVKRASMAAKAECNELQRTCDHICDSSPGNIA